MGDINALSGPHKDELAYPVHRMGPKTASGNPVYELCNVMMIRQMTVAADVAPSEEWLIPKLG